MKTNLLFKSALEYKRMFGIPSEAALRYVKAQQEYESLRSKLRSDVSAGDLSMRQVANLCGIARELVTIFLMERMPANADFSVKPYNRFHPERYLSKYSLSVGFDSKIDYEQLIQDVLKNITQRQTLYDRVMEPFARRVARVQKCFSGESLNHEEVERKSLSLAELVDYFAAEESLFNDSKSTEQAILDDSERKEIIQRHKQRVRKIDLDGITTEERVYLYSGEGYKPDSSREYDRFYDRALEEGTLRRSLQVERRIAFLDVIEYADREDVPTSEDPVKLVKDTISFAEERIRTRKNRLRELIEQRTVAYIIRKEKKLIAQAEYTRAALRKNEAQIVAVLSGTTPEV